MFPLNSLIFRLLFKSERPKLFKKILLSFFFFNFIFKSLKFLLLASNEWILEKLKYFIKLLIVSP